MDIQIDDKTGLAFIGKVRSGITLLSTVVGTIVGNIDVTIMADEMVMEILGAMPANHAADILGWYAQTATKLVIGHNISGIDDHEIRDLPIYKNYAEPISFDKITGEITTYSWKDTKTVRVDLHTKYRVCSVCGGVTQTYITVDTKVQCTACPVYLHDMRVLQQNLLNNKRERAILHGQKNE